jgi:hypothetical protein
MSLITYALPIVDATHRDSVSWIAFYGYIINSCKLINNKLNTLKGET